MPPESPMPLARPAARRAPSALACLLAASALLGCGRKDAREESADPAAADSAAADSTTASAGGDTSDTAASAGASQTAQQTAQPAADAAAAPLTAADIDRWQKGMEGEQRAVEEAAAKLKTARSGNDTLLAMMGVQETATTEAGARAAGVDPERYKVSRSNLSAAAQYLTPELGGIDTTMLSPAQRQEMRQMNEAQLANMREQLPPDVVEALRPRAAELRKQALALAGARMKGAGM
jgi:hypothetical protein